MTPDQLEKLLTRRESATVERKESARQLPRSLFESVCAFLNQDGGTILLGVADDGTVVGVEADAVERLTVEIANLSNNPQKLNPPFILSPLSLDYQGKHVLVLQVPVSSQIHRCNGIVYDRGHEGDFRVTDPVRIAAMVNRKQNYYTELTVYPYLHVSDFEPGLLDKARRLIRAMTPKHPWLPLSDEELLHKAGFWRNDPLTGREGYTLAAGLMFGKEEVIQQLVPHYKIDALVRRENLDRYDDRLNIRGNLIEAYDLLMDFVAKHLSDPFYLDGIQRVSLRDKIFREIVANLLVHREYTDARPATLIIYRDRVETTNAAHPHGHGPIAPERFTPYSKNPTLSKFFMQMGRGEELGSGVLNVSKYLPLYAKGAKAQFVEGNPFISVIPLPAETGVKSPGKGEEKSREKSEEKSREKILKMIRQKPTVTTQEMMDSLGLSRAGVEKIVKKLKQERRISRVGPDKGGHWEVVKEQQS